MTILESVIPRQFYVKGWRKNGQDQKEDLNYTFNRPCVAGAVLQTALLLINLITNSFTH